MIGKLFFFGCCLVAIPSMPAQAGEMSHYQKDFTPTGSIVIKNDRGSVTVSGWDQPRISVQGEVDEQFDSFVFDVDRAEAIIEVPVERGKKLGQPTDLTVKVPAGVSIFVSGVSSNLNLSGLHGPVRIKTVSGDVNIDQVSGSLQIDSVSGSTEIHQLNGSMSYESISGDLIADTHSDAVLLKTVSGDVSLDLQEGKKADISSVSGDIRVSGGFVDYPDVTIKTVSGDIQVRLADPVDARLSVAAITNTDVRINLPQSGLSDLSITAKQFSHNIGSGLGKILLSTVQGDISVTER